MALQHKYTLVCEDVRQENTGKWMIAGLYSQRNIAIPQLPLIFPSIAFFFCFNAESAGQYKFRFELRHLDTGTLMAPPIQGLTGMSKPGAMVLPFRLVGLQFRAHGSYSASVAFEGEADPFMTEFVLEIAQMPPQFGQPFRQ